MADSHSNQRPIVQTIQERAKQVHGNYWASFPRNGKNMSSKFTHVSFRELNNIANAVSYSLKQWLPKSDIPSQPFAYVGPNDIRYPILAIAAAKARKVVGSSTGIPIQPQKRCHDP